MLKDSHYHVINILAFQSWFLLTGQRHSSTSQKRILGVKT